MEESLAVCEHDVRSFYPSRFAHSSCLGVSYRRGSRIFRFQASSSPSIDERNDQQVGPVGEGEWAGGVARLHHTAQTQQHPTAHCKATRVALDHTTTRLPLVARRWTLRARVFKLGRRRADATQLRQGEKQKARTLSRWRPTLRRRAEYALGSIVRGRTPACDSQGAFSCDRKQHEGRCALHTAGRGQYNGRAGSAAASRGGGAGSQPLQCLS